MSTKPQIAVYYFPNYHVDSRNEDLHGQGWTEWELVKHATPRWSGHNQPRVPLWGYTDEADPQQMAQKIDAAADHGIDAFLFDWYYYDKGPFLQRGLEEGFMQATNAHRLKFALMWANHDWINIHPTNFKNTPDLLHAGKITPETWDQMTDLIITRYFQHSSYWMVDNAPYFSIYDLGKFIENFGNPTKATAALASFRAKVIKAGFADLHLNAVVWGGSNWADFVPTQTDELATVASSVRTLGFNSVTSYVWIHHAALPEFPETSYTYAMQEYGEYRARAKPAFNNEGLPYHPNVTMGWDSSPRTLPSDTHANIGYPYMPALKGNTPEAFESALRDASAFLKDVPENEKILTINAWNEWTEGSYLEPDTVHGMAYLEAIRAVFGK